MTHHDNVQKNFDELTKQLSWLSKQRQKLNGGRRPAVTTKHLHASIHDSVSNTF